MAISDYSRKMKIKLERSNATGLLNIVKRCTIFCRIATIVFVLLLAVLDAWFIGVVFSKAQAVQSSMAFMLFNIALAVVSAKLLGLQTRSSLAIGFLSAFASLGWFFKNYGADITIIQNSFCELLTPMVKTIPSSLVIAANCFIINASAYTWQWRAVIVMWLYSDLIMAPLALYICAARATAEQVGYTRSPSEIASWLMPRPDSMLLFAALGLLGIAAKRIYTMMRTRTN